MSMNVTKLAVTEVPFLNRKEYIGIAYCNLALTGVYF